MVTTLSKDLYVQPKYTPADGDLRKHATHRLSPHVSNWTVEVLKIIGEDYPWVVEGMRPATVDLEKVNKDTGTGFGGVVIWAKRQAPGGKGTPNYTKQQKLPAGPTIVIPFVVRNFEMSPLDIFVAEKKVLPLTPKRVAEAMQAHEIFSGVDRSRITDMSSLQGSLQPPPEAFYGQFGRQYGGGEGQGFGRHASLGDRMLKASGAEKVAGSISTQDSLILNQVLSTSTPDEMKSFSDRICKDPATLAQFVRNKNVDVLNKIIKARPLTASDIKNTERWAFPKNVLLFEKVSAGQWKVTTHNDFSLSGDVMRLSEKELLEEFSDFKSVRERLWNSNGFIVTVDHKETKPVVWHDNMKPDTTPVNAPGVWLVVTGNKQIAKGFSWKGFCDFECNHLNYCLWYDGNTFSVQERIQGERLSGEDWEFSEDALKPGVWGTWLHTHENGDQNPSMPFKILAVYTKDKSYEGKVLIRATDLFGHEVNFIVTPGIEKMHSATGILDPVLAGELGARAYFVPAETPFITLGSQKIPLVEHARELTHAFRDTALSSISLTRDKAHPATSLVVTCTDRHAGTYRLEGNILEPLTAVNAIDCSKLKAKWLLVMHGCSVEEAERILTQANSMNRTHVYVMALRPMKYEATIRTNLNGEIIKVSKAMRRNLLKEAAYIKDKNSVDAMLSLNFISPDNLIVFLQSLDKYRDVESSLAKLLLMTRMGLEAVPESAVASALKNVNTVTEALEMLQGVLGQKTTPEGEVELQESVEDERKKTPSNADTTLG